LPTLPLDEIALLIIDEMGKDISGEGLTPVSWDVRYALSVQSVPGPKMTWIFVRDLTSGSEGSALGFGQDDMEPEFGSSGNLISRLAGFRR